MSMLREIIERIIIVGVIFILIDHIISLEIFQNLIKNYTFLNLAIKCIKVLILSLFWINITNLIIKHCIKFVPETFNPKAVANTIKFASYSLLLIAILYLFGVNPVVLLAGGTAVGIVLGLAAQQTLSNLFAGVIILITRIIEPGDKIRIITWELPYYVIFLPAYKNFSKDYAIQGYCGTVEEIGLLFTKIKLETGEIFIVPNSLLIRSTAIINYTKSLKEKAKGLLKVRYEFPVKVGTNRVLSELPELLKDLGSFKIYIEEQSDKDYFIVVIEGYVDEAKQEEIKSEILKRLVEYHRSLQ